MRDFEPGQVWEITLNDGKTIQVLLLACHDSFANTLKILDFAKTESAVMLRAVGYVDPRYVNTTNYSMMSNPVTDISAEEMDSVKAAVCKELGIAVADVTTDDRRSESIAMQMLRKERDIYKNFYDRMLDRR